MINEERRDVDGGNKMIRLRTVGLSFVLSGAIFGWGLHLTHASALPPPYGCHNTRTKDGWHIVTKIRVRNTTCSAARHMAETVGLKKQARWNGFVCHRVRMGDWTGGEYCIARGGKRVSYDVHN